MTPDEPYPEHNPDYERYVVQRQFTCQVNPVSSRVCFLGTKSCDTHTANYGYERQELDIVFTPCGPDCCPGGICGAERNEG